MNTHPGSRIFCLTLANLVATIFASSPLLAQDKIGYINIPRIINESEIGKQANAELNAQSQQREAEVKEKRLEIEGLNEKIRLAKQERPPDQIKLKIWGDALAQKNKELKRFLEDVKEELGQMERALVSGILLKADPVLKRIAQEKQFAIVLKNSNDLAYLNPSYDLTNEIIKALNPAKTAPKH